MYCPGVPFSHAVGEDGVLDGWPGAAKTLERLVFWYLMSRLEATIVWAGGTVKATPRPALLPGPGVDGMADLYPRR